MINLNDILINLIRVRSWKKHCNAHKHQFDEKRLLNLYFFIYVSFKYNNNVTT